MVPFETAARHTYLLSRSKRDSYEKDTSYRNPRDSNIPRHQGIRAPVTQSERVPMKTSQSDDGLLFFETVFKSVAPSISMQQQLESSVSMTKPNTKDTQQHAASNLLSLPKTPKLCWELVQQPAPTSHTNSTVHDRTHMLLTPVSTRKDT